TLRGASRSSRRNTIRALAEQFGVSEDVVLRQLAALLLPRADDLDEPTTGGGSATPSRVPGSGGRRLDAWQRAAAESGTPALIVAGPGTGKTSTLVGRVAYLVRERSIAPSAILALTFSNKAAREMRERLGALLAPAEDEAPEALAAP